ncbi:HD domain-containing phosphohydrolase [Occallatibacter riparius]|uniref:HD domain-containing protein n=1 Tax=Occallatibacter riparius TaxID=1002689 RepID=A0A9J7BUN5_9BACT|nr:HD domain-containing phosphohydrolase [Occallatibacter riparius]UWZ85466.1 HD domain-containing protein [Occallatibacter riparius]
MTETAGELTDFPRDPTETNLRLYELSWKIALDGKVIIELPSGRILDCNPAAERMAGLPRAAIVGRRVEELLSPEDEPRVLELLGEMSPLPERLRDFRLVRPNGQAFAILVSTSGALTLDDGRVVSVCEFQDLSVQKHQEHRLATKRWALSAYAAAANALSDQHNQSSLLRAICAAIVTEPAYVFAWIGVAEHDAEQTMRVAAEAGPGSGLLEGLRLTWGDNERGQGPASKAIRTGTIQIVPDTRKMQASSPWTDRFIDFGIDSCIAVPFQAEELRGALVVCAENAEAFGQVPVDMFTHLAQQVAHGLIAIQHDHLLKAEREHALAMERRLNEAMLLMIEPMSLAMEMRDPYTAGHQNRVADIAVAIGAEMGWTADRLRGLRIAALIHDIGKMSIPAEILTKPGRLSATERALVSEHCEHGYRVLKGIPFPWPVAAMVLQHHEKLDGSGYPNGLKGETILPETRVLTVADMLEGMSSHRPYRAAHPIEKALEILESEAGTALDAEVVAVCARLCGEGKLTEFLDR